MRGEKTRIGSQKKKKKKSRETESDFRVGESNNTNEDNKLVLYFPCFDLSTENKEKNDGVDLR